MEGCIKEEVVNIFDVVTSTLPALGIALGEPGACSNNLPRESPWMQFATEFWNGRAIVKMICKYGEAVLVVGLGETPSFADERALRRSVDTVYVGARDVLPDQARGAISWRYFNTFKVIYDSLCDGPFTMVQGGGIMLRGSLLAHYRRERWP